MRRRIDVLGLLALFLTAGCYSYRTIPIADVQPDLEVRVRVTPEATGRVAQVMGYLTQNVEGTVVYLRQDTVMLTVVSPTAPEARTVQRLYQRLDLPLSQVIEVERKSLDRGKTYASIALAVAGGGVLAVWAFSGVLGGTGQDNGVVIDNRVVPSQLVLRLGRLQLGR